MSDLVLIASRVKMSLSSDVIAFKQCACAGLDLGALLSGVVTVPQAAPTAAPPGSRAQRRKKAKIKRAATKLARAGGSQGPAPVTVTPPVPKGKGKGAQTASPDRPKGPNHGPGAGGTGEPSKGKGKATPATTKGAKTAAPLEEAGWVTVRKKRQDASAQNWQLRGNDWDAPVVQYDAVAEALQKVDGAAFKAVVLCSKDEAATLGTLLKPSGVSHAVRVVSVAAKASEGQRCPGQVDGSLAFAACTSLRSIQTGCTCPSRRLPAPWLKRSRKLPPRFCSCAFRSSS